MEPKPEKLDICFGYYLLKFLKLNFYAGGAAQPLLTQNVLKQIPTSIPPLDMQIKIGSILTAYDDLIENNTRRIQILEEMAQRVYREWFVNFRFPGYEKVKMVKSELGMIPEVWEVKNLSDLCLIVMGQSPKSEFYNDEGLGLPFHQGVKGFGKIFPTHQTYCTIENRIAEEGDILFSVRAPDRKRRKQSMHQQDLSIVITCSKVNHETLSPDRAAGAA